MRVGHVGLALTVERMRVVRFLHNLKEQWGVVQGDDIVFLAAPPFSRIDPTRMRIPLAGSRLLAPSTPSKIILAGLNYRKHAAEMALPIPAEPVIFLKPPTSLLGDRGKIVYPQGILRLDFEAELALVIKKTARNVSAARAPEYIFGYTCLNDVTARDLQKKDTQWTRSKSFDTFCPMGPWIETEFDPADRRIRAVINGRTAQDSSTRDFIFSPAYLVSFISRVMTLCPGDVISTGTPPGVGAMAPGDSIAVEIDGIGRLENRVTARPSAAACRE